MSRKRKTLLVDTVPLIAVRVVTLKHSDLYEGKREWWGEWFGGNYHDLVKLKWPLR